MAWSPPALIAGIVWVSAPGDYATLNSNHTPDGTNNTVSARLKPPGEAAVNTATGSSTAGQGERPGGTASQERVMTVTITGIDKSAQSITFTGPNGWKYSRRVADPTVLDKVKVGDQVDITWDTNVTVAVQ